MKQLFFLVLLLGLSPLVLAQTIIQSQSFETNETVNYTSNRFDLRSSTDGSILNNQYFTITTTNPAQNPNLATNYSLGHAMYPVAIKNAAGTANYTGNFWIGEGIRGINNTGTTFVRAPGFVALNAVNASTYTGIKVTLGLADPRGPNSIDVNGNPGSPSNGTFNNTDKIEIQYSTDGGANYIPIGRFMGNNNGGSLGFLEQDADLNGEVLTETSSTLTYKMTDYTFNVAGSPASLIVRVLVDQSGTSQELAFDNIRVTGTPTTVQAPTLTDAQSGNVINYTEGDPATLVTTTILANNPAGTDLTGATVTINSSVISNDDQLTFTGVTGSGITGTYNNTSRTLTFTGQSAETNYQTILQSVRYVNNNINTARGGNRTIQFMVSNGSSTSSVVIRNVLVKALLNSPAMLPYTDDFTTDGEGTRYSSNTFAGIGGNTGFAFTRTSANPYATDALTFSNISNTAYWYGVNAADIRFNPSQVGRLETQQVDATRYINLRFQIWLGAESGSGAAWQASDSFKMYYRTGGSSGTWKLFGSFRGSTTSINATADMRQDRPEDLANLPTLPAGTATLIPALANFSFNIPADANGQLVDFKLELIADDGRAEFAFDLIQVTGTPLVAPTVTTAAPTGVASISATLGGNVTADGGANVTARGVVYSSTNTTPTINGSGVIQDDNGAGNGLFTKSISGLAGNTTYYVRAYATNLVNTSYGSAQQFTTSNNPPTANNDAITVNQDAGATVVNVLTNDNSGPDTGETLTVSAITQPATGGSVTLTSGVVRFTPSITFRGNTTFTYTISDGHGGTATATVTVTVVDNIRPTVSISSSVSGSTSTSPIPITVTFSEAVTGFVAGDVTVSNGTPSSVTGTGTTYRFNVTPTTTNGVVTVAVPANVAQDAAANFNTTATSFFFTYVQPVTPAPVVITPADGSSISVATPTYTGTASASSIVTVYIDGASSGTTTAQSSNWSFTQPTSLTEGSHTVRATAQLSGQVVSASSNTNSFTVDITAPQTTLTATPPNSSPSSDATFSFVGSDGSGSGIARLETSLDGGTFSAATSPQSFVGLADGNHSFAVRAVDVAGNVDTTPASFTWTVDTTRPTVSISSSVSGTTSTSPIPITVTFSEAVTGFVAGDVTVSNGAPSSVSGTGTTYRLTVTPAASGLVTVNVPNFVAQDAAGNGNTPSTTISITYEPTPTITSFTAVNATICAGAVVGFTATLGNVGSGYTYTLSDGQNSIPGSGTGTAFSQSLTVNTPGPRSFTLAVVSSGYSASATTIVTVNPIPTPTIIDLAGSYCKNGPDMPLTGSPTGGIFTVDGTTALTFSPASLSVGQHTVVYSYTSTGGCSATTSQSVIVNPTPTPTLVASGTLTCAQTSVTLTAGGATTYQFSGPGTINQSANTAIVTVAGLYSVTVTNGSGCSSTTTVTVDQDINAPLVSITPSTGTPAGTTLTCASPSVSLTAVGIGTVRWSTTETTPVILVSTANTYSVTLTGSNGCTATASVVVSTDQNAPLVSITPASATLTCASPSVSLSAVGSGTYQWSTGATTQIISVTSATTYLVTLTGANGCTATASTQVFQDNSAPLVSITPSSATLTCATSSVSLSVIGNGTYQWSTGATSPGISATSASTYSVTLTGANGCTATASAQVFEDFSLPALNLTPSSATLTCTNPSATLTANGNGTYQWSTGATTSSIPASASGIYSVTLTGANGCTATASAQVFQDTNVPLVSITPSSATLSCATTSVSLSAVGSGTFLWSTGATTSLISATSVGTYSVTSTATNGCTATASVQVFQDNMVPVASITPTSATLTCTNPSATLMAAGNGTYRWSTGATTQAISASAAGVYSVTIKAANGCTATASAQVSQDTNVPSLSISPASATLSCATTSVSLSAVGTGTFMWSTGAATSSISASAVGTYSVTLTGANGCIATASAQVSQDINAPSVSINPASATLTCANPIITLMALGNGTYRWNTGATTQIISATSAGTYSVTLTASNGCSNTASATIYQDNSLPTLSILPASATLTCSTNSVSLSALGNGTYQWSTGATTSSISVSATGTYSVTLTGANGCMTTASAQVFQDNSVPMVSITPTSATLTCAIPSTTLTATGNGTYRWSTGATSPSISVSALGTYSVTITAVNGCTATASAQVFLDNSVPTVSITPTSATLSCTNTSATLSANGNGTYQWSTGATTPSISATMAATYSVTLTGANGCTATASAQVFQNNTIPSVGITPSSATLTCANPTVVLSVSGSGLYQWSTGATTSSISASVAGTYSVTLTGGNGCTATASAQVFQDNSVPSVSINPSSATLTCASPSATLTASGNGTYRWSTGATTSSILVNAAGTYSVTITAANGCIASASAQVSRDSNLPTVSITPASATLTCATPTVTLSANGNGTYRWSTGATSPSISVSVAGTYSVTLTGANGCSAFANAQVSQDNVVPAPTLMASALNTVNQPITVTASGCSGTLNWQLQGGSGQASGAIYTLSTPGNYTLTATCTLGTCTSPPAPALVLTIQAPNTNFAITSVSMVNCYKTNPNRGEYVVQFTPRYAGQNGNPISFSVVNELVPTTQPAPYTLNLYQDKPFITLVANQAGNGEARYVYNWLASCASGGSPNQPPTTVGIGPQTSTLNQPFQLNLSGYFTDPEGQPLTYSAQGLPAGVIVTGNLLSGAPTQTGTFGVTITAIDPGNLSVSASFNLTVQTQPSQPTSFAIMGVTPVSCEVLKADQRRVRFNPQYSGLTGQSVTFRVVNELPPTTQPGPYSLDLYTDNPVLELRASQAGTAGEVSFSYNWLAACANTPPVSAAPTVTQSIPNQVGTVGLAFIYSIPAATFSDPNGDALVLTDRGLPAGLSLNGSVISGTPSVSGVSTVFITATDPGGLSTSTSFVLTINQMGGPTTGFTITGVNLLSCQAVSGQQRVIRFSPQYTGLTGQPVSFSVVNELAPTTAGGPYELRLYLDNPVIMLKATQSGTAGEASFSYNWLAACSNPSARQSAEKLPEFKVQVLGNPVVGEWVEVLVTGAGQQALQATTINERGVAVDRWQTGSASDQERLRLRVGPSGGVYLLTVEASSQRQTIKLIKH